MSSVMIAWYVVKRFEWNVEEPSLILWIDLDRGFVPLLRPLGIFLASFKCLNEQQSDTVVHPIFVHHIQYIVTSWGMPETTLLRNTGSLTVRLSPDTLEFQSEVYTRSRGRSIVVSRLTMSYTSGAREGWAPEHLERKNITGCAFDWLGMSVDAPLSI